MNTHCHCCGSDTLAELEQLARWVRDTSNYERDDAPDEIARAIENRIRTLRTTKAGNYWRRGKSA